MVSREINGLNDENELELAPHLDDFTQDPFTVARGKLDDLLDASCEVPLKEVNQMATDVGISTADLLLWAEKSETCHVDYLSGHIRCSDEPEVTPEDG
jgi:hypothetical protein|tara:strand:+ start:1085 stop:1378 length:294 start_codon:yes stop_codon:yes gene_type:complete